MSTPPHKTSATAIPDVARTRTSRTTTRQKEAGAASREETRRRLVIAAAECFAERGYSGSTVSAIAERAGVALQTLYLAWGSKRALLRAYMEYALSGSPTAISDDDWSEQVRTQVRCALPEDADQRTRIKVAAQLFRRVAERAALGWRLYRDAAGTDPDIAADEAELSRLRRHTMASLCWMDPAELRTGITPESALDTLMVIAGPESYRLLVDENGYSLDQYQEWIESTLQAALLRD